MALKKLEMCFAIAIASIMCGGAAAQSSCTTVLVSMSSCLSYVSGSSPTPSSSCCSALSNVVQTQPRCLCSVLNAGGSSLGVSINQTLALHLPAACNVQTPPASRCNGGGGSGRPSTSSAAPVDTPTGSQDNKEPEAPTSEFPAGSKAVPSTQGSTSNGIIINKISLHILVIIVSVVSYTSAIITI
ncbi:hypothetical protein Nepgr_004248 [Nepenthes gracilis]|uniref:Bifunctional inhibitor/plant lipid transfer protein/seed storage helical domain-containing protein n=1 Tax=Nepenthes gracilis TaxID=150966 RepID=A0AAD3S1A3_NEPGR|nr:hypothetical protein Nepgr_004248 [Nepenthes gracilis]